MEAVEASVPDTEPGEAAVPGIGAADSALHWATDSLYAAAAWCAYVHFDTVDHGPCSSRQGVHWTLPAWALAWGPSHCL